MEDCTVLNDCIIFGIIPNRSAQTQTLAFLESTFSGVKSLQELSRAVNSITGGTVRAVTRVSPWGGRLLSEYGGAVWRSALIPAVRPSLIMPFKGDKSYSG